MSPQAEGLAVVEAGEGGQSPRWIRRSLASVLVACACSSLVAIAWRSSEEVDWRGLGSATGTGTPARQAKQEARQGGRAAARSEGVRVPKEALARLQPTVLAAGQPGVNRLVISGANATWGCSTNRGGSVVTVPLKGGTPTTLATLPGTSLEGQGVHALAVDGASVYFAGARTGLLEVPLGGGAVTTLVAPGATSTNIFNLAVDATSVYWTTDKENPGLVLSVPLAGGTPTTLASRTPAFGPCMAFTPGTMFLRQGASILALPTAGGEPTPRVVQPTGSIGCLTADATHLYWPDQARGALMRATRDGAQVSTIGVGIGFQPGAVAVDDAFVYWTANALGPGSAVVRAPKGGGGVPVPLAVGDGFAGNVAVDATTVYWLGGDKVFAHAK